MNLIDSITATDATKQRFDLTKKDFLGGAVAMLKSRGLGTGDTIRIFEFVNEEYQDTGVTLADDQTSRIVDGVGQYAVDAVLATSGPVSCDLNTVNQ